MGSFRRATIADLSTLRVLAERIWRISYAEMLSPAQIDYMLAWMYDSAEITHQLDRGILWEILEHDAHPIGFLSLNPEPGPRMKLEKLYLLPEFQGRGLGQTMIHRALDLARQHGARELWLQVNKQNQRALRAYERAGFQRQDEAVFDIGAGFVMDDYLLALPVQA